MLTLVQDFFGGIGHITQRKGFFQYTVQNLTNCIVISNAVAGISFIKVIDDFFFQCGVEF